MCVDVVHLDITTLVVAKLVHRHNEVEDIRKRDVNPFSPKAIICNKANAIIFLQEVKMISAEAPILFAKGCDIFITELTMRAWIHAEENKRRTLQRSDIASALAKSDMFDFLIDIVPREEAASNRRSGAGHGSSAQQAAAGAIPQGAVAQQTGMHPPPTQQMQPAEYSMDPHMQAAGMYPGAVQGMQPQDPNLPYGQYPQQQIFNQPDMQNMYYPMPQPPAVSDS